MTRVPTVPTSAIPSRFLLLAGLAISLAGSVAVPCTAVADPFFEARFLSFETGGGLPAIGDLNGDGKPDLVTTYISVVLGNGDGTFGAATRYYDGHSSWSSVALGDVNGDGRLDVVAGLGYTGGSTVSVLLGNGDGTLGAIVEYGTGGGVSMVALADLNADGRLDVAVASHYSSAASVLLGNGDGTFGAQIDYSTGSTPACVSIGDLNGDGRPDLVVGCPFVNTVSVLLGNGDGSFGAGNDFVTGNNPVAVAIADVNGDARLDLAVANYFSSTVSVLLGNGDGTFGSKTDYVTANYPRSLAIEDLTGDGKRDLVVAAYSGVLTVLLGRGDGVFDAVTSNGSRVGTDLAIGDLNGDGNLDLALSNPDLTTIAILLGNGDGTFGVDTDFPTGISPGSIAIADMNVDGKLDLVTPNLIGTVSVLLGAGDGTFGAHTDYAMGGPSFTLAVGDLNGDGKPDVVIPNGASAVSVLLGNGDGSLGPPTPYATGDSPRWVAIGDMNGDGRPDLVTANAFSSNVSVLLGRGDGTFDSPSHYATGFLPVSLAIGDLNGDGRLDLVVADYYSHGISVLLGNGDGTFADRVGYGVAADVVALGDVNGDGKLDVGVADARNRTVAVLVGNGDGTFGEPIIDYMHPAIPVWVAFEDLTADGNADLVAAVGTGLVSVWPNIGDGTLGVESSYGTGNNPNAVAIGDLNGDGRPDLATANMLPNTVSVLLHTAGGGGTPLAVTFDFTPNTLNLASHGLRVTGFLEPAAPFAAADIDVSTIRLNDTVPVDPAAPTALGDHNGNGVADLMLKFNRVAVELTLSEGDNVPINVAGSMGGRSFLGTDYIRVIRAVVSAPLAGSHLTAGSVTQVSWQVPSDVTAQSVALLQSLDGGATWSLITHGQPNNGSYDWTVPNVQTDQAKVAVEMVESGDGTVEGVLGMSGAFTIDALVGVGDRGPAQFALRGVTPNPAQHELQVRFSLKDSKAATLGLFDVSGRQVDSRRVDGLGPGWHSVTLGGRVSLPAGLYIIRLTQDGQSLTSRVALIR